MYKPIPREVAEYFSYNPETGEIIRIKDIPSGGVYKGEVAGYIRKDGYRVVKFKGRALKGHRLAYFLHTGEEPAFLDHKNLDRADNRFSNLRPATKAQNGQNRTCLSNNTSGFMGVTRDGDRWRVAITTEGRKERIGWYRNKWRAAIAYNREAIKRHKEFANLNKLPGVENHIFPLIKQKYSNIGEDGLITCRKCGTRSEPANFLRNKRRLGGYDNLCKTCEKTRKRK